MENNPWCRFDPYAQQKLEQREAVLKKFYSTKLKKTPMRKASRRAQQKKSKGSKKWKPKKGCVSLVKIRKCGL